MSARSMLRPRKALGQRLRLLRVFLGMFIIAVLATTSSPRAGKPLMRNGK